MTESNPYWSSGYITEVNYSADYQKPLNPLRARLALLSSGYACPKVNVACELGFGLGHSANIHAAASITEWYGTDFNPSQALFARNMASASGANIKLFDEAFAEFCNRKDLPDFDFIGLHGIWSWISADNRDLIVDFVRRKLKLGGVLYVSYNTLPGWSDFVPMRELMMKHFEVMSAKGRGVVSRVEDALNFANRLLTTKPAIIHDIPSIEGRMERMNKMAPTYLAHEFFNAHWNPMYFADMVTHLEPAKVKYVCSSEYMNLLEYLKLTGEQRAFLAEIPDLMFRESVQSFMTNEQFRQDYWVRGATRLAAPEQARALREERVILVFDPGDILPLVIKSKFSEVTVSEEVVRPLIDLMSDHRARSLGEIADALKPKGIGLRELVGTVVTLIASQIFAVAQPEEESALAARTSADLNAYLLNRAPFSGEIDHLASPITGGGVKVPRSQQIFLNARRLGMDTPAEWARYCFEVMKRPGQRAEKDGEPVESQEETLAAAMAEAEKFNEKQLPLLKAQGVVV